MSKRYSSDYRQLIEHLLQLNDIDTIHRLTSVPERTLREWRKRRQLQQRSSGKLRQPRK